MQIITDSFQKETKKHGSDGFPFLVSHERLSRYESGSFLWHWHPEIEITIVEEGRMTYRVNDQSFSLKAGDLLFGNANVLHAGFMQDAADCVYTAVTFSARLIYGFSQSSIHTDYVEPLLWDFSLPAIHFDHSESWHGSFGKIVGNLLRLDEHKPPFYELEITAGLQLLWKELLSHQQPTPHCNAHSRTEYERIRKILGYIEKNYSQKILLKDISDHIHLCESECCRLFKRYMNQPLSVFLQEYRIERSLEELTAGEDPIGLVAERAGFSDSNYYTKVFQKKMGCSPRQYRKLCKKGCPNHKNPRPGNRRP